MTMAMPQEQLYTYADLIDWGEDQRFELYQGAPVALAAPSTTHQEVVMALSAQLYNYLRGKKCRVYPAPFDVCLFAGAEDSPADIDTVLQPDITVVCDPKKLTERGCSGAPDLVVEVLSPRDRRRDRQTKFDLYQRAGVREYWIVDPEAQVAQIHTLEEGRYHSPAAYNAKGEAPVGVLEGCVIRLAEVFGIEG